MGSQTQEIVTESATGEVPLRRSRFVIYDVYDEPMGGWTDGSKWNGWATPMFEHAAALKIVEMHNNLMPLDPADKGRAWYDAAGDQFCFVLASTGGEVESYSASVHVTDSEERKLYSIGSWYWTWEETAE